MNKSELIAAIAAKSEISKTDAQKALNAFIEIVTEQLSQRESVQIIGFGNFEVVEYSARTGRNPQTGKPLQIPGGLRAKFAPGAQLKKAVNK